jgi:hypothetical protein
MQKSLRALVQYLLHVDAEPVIVVDSCGRIIMGLGTTIFLINVVCIV